MTKRTGATVEAWCLRVHADASATLSLYDAPHLNFAFNFNLRRYTTAPDASDGDAALASLVTDLHVRSPTSTPPASAHGVETGSNQSFDMFDMTDE
jgi:hypothetical protein